jgi:hypothetical protein
MGENQNLHASNTCIVANMIELGVEVMCKINPDYVAVGNTEDAREMLSEALGAHILNNIVRTAGV